MNPRPPRALILHLTAPPWVGRAGLDDAWVERFGPVLRGLIDARTCRVGLLLGGRLAEEWATRHPEVVHGLRLGLAEGRFEILASSLHGAVLSAIPETDALDQLLAHVTVLKRVLGARANGGWVPQGVWDPTVPRLFAKAGLTWTCLERSWLTDVRAPAGRVLSVEREGRAVAVIPYDRDPARPDGLVALRVDGRADVDVALGAIGRATALPSALIQQTRTRAYLPSGGPGGLWERRLLEDGGADALHSRMLAVSRHVRRLGKAVEASSHTDDGPDPGVLQQARRYLYRAQAAEAFGPTPAMPTFRGGCRDRAWRDLSRAEKLVDDALGLPACDSATRDADCDGIDEIRLKSARWAVAIAPGREGVLTEVTDRKSSLNLVGGQLPVGFRELWGDGMPVADRWSLVTTETPGDGSIRSVLVADGALDQVPVRLTKCVHLPASGPLEIRIDVTNRGTRAARGMLVTELYAVLGGPRLEGEQDASLTVEVAGGKVPLDEVIELPHLDCVSLVGWRGRVELEPVPNARVELVPLDEGAARVRFTWPMDLLERDRERREIRVSVREVPRV